MNPFAYLESLNRAIDCMENNLGQTVAMEEIALAAGYSRFHFDRLFLATVGLTPAGYLRKRRLSEAALELVASHKQILDIALDYGFQSQEAFTRAFKKEFSLNPGAYRKRSRSGNPFFRVRLRHPDHFAVHCGFGRVPRIIVPGPEMGFSLAVPSCMAVVRHASQPTNLPTRGDAFFLLA